ncbi:hypothetical protein Pfo_026582 [Paulownia fortunei]|nr:hypothetical protein Pfo_026582 [Paulownia fortunei]
MPPFSLSTSASQTKPHCSSISIFFFWSPTLILSKKKLEKGARIEIVFLQTVDYGSLDCTALGRSIG